MNLNFMFLLYVYNYVSIDFYFNFSVRDFCVYEVFLYEFSNMGEYVVI